MENLIPFRLKRGKQSCDWHDAKGNSYKLGDPELQAKGLPEDVFKEIEKTGRIAAIKEKENGDN